MKKEAENFLFKELKSILSHEKLNGLVVEEMNLSKAKQSNKKPCYHVQYCLGTHLGFQLYVYQNNEAQWGYGREPGAYFLQKEDLVKEISVRKEIFEKNAHKFEADKQKQQQILNKQTERATRRNKII